VNLDLIYGTEGESLESWERTLREAIALAPEHVSADALTIEPATALGRQIAAGTRRSPDPDVQADMFEAACELLREAGYHHYEVSNWARPGFECQHNLGYWERRSYVGLGAGAHAYRDDVRWWNVRPPETIWSRWRRGAADRGSESLDPSDAYLEEVFLKLRILEGVPRAGSSRSGTNPSSPVVCSSTSSGSWSRPSAACCRSTSWCSASRASRAAGFQPPQPAVVARFRRDAVAARRDELLERQASAPSR
jgi:oxygen-independent coproporphyrinogen-3 oxidase